jgi:hypothetical protein
MFDLKGKHEHVFLSILNKYIFLCRKRPFDFFKEKGGCAGTDKVSFHILDTFYESARMIC